MGASWCEKSGKIASLTRGQVRTSRPQDTVLSRLREAVSRLHLPDYRSPRGSFGIRARAAGEGTPTVPPSSAGAAGQLARLVEVVSSPSSTRGSFLHAGGRRAPHATSFAAAAAGWSSRGCVEVVVSVSDGNSLFLVLPYQIRDSGVGGPVAVWRCYRIQKCRRHVEFYATPLRQYCGAPFFSCLGRALEMGVGTAPTEKRLDSKKK